ncbi:MAG: hypothetical protein LBG13_01010 [Holosporales bacterium]|nr:hypothetical protein [Holosporales bacterium]
MLCVLSACGIFAGNCCASGSEERFEDGQIRSNIAAPNLGAAVPQHLKYLILQSVREDNPSTSAKKRLEEIKKTYQEIVTKYGVLPNEVQAVYGAAVKAYNRLESLTNEVRNRLYSITDETREYEDSIYKVGRNGDEESQPLLSNSDKTWNVVRKGSAAVFFDGRLEEYIQRKLAPPRKLTEQELTEQPQEQELTEQERTQYTALLEQVKQWRSNELNWLTSKAVQMQDDLQILGAAEGELLGFVQKNKKEITISFGLGKEAASSFDLESK